MNHKHLLLLIVTSLLMVTACGKLEPVQSGIKRSVAQNELPQLSLSTHVDLAGKVELAPISTFHGKPVHWVINDAQHGQARLTENNQTLIFQPDPAFSGKTQIALRASDGEIEGRIIPIFVTVSSAKLRAIHLDELNRMEKEQAKEGTGFQVGAQQTVHATGDFEDATGVDLSLQPSYLTITNEMLETMGVNGAPAFDVNDATDTITAKRQGPAIIRAARLTDDGREVQAVVTLRVQPRPPVLLWLLLDTMSIDFGNYGDLGRIGRFDTSSLVMFPGATRKLGVTIKDPDSSRIVDVQGEKTMAGSRHSGSTRYYVSDPSIAKISKDGEISALREGVVTVSVVHAHFGYDANGRKDERVMGQIMEQTNVDLSVVPLQTLTPTSASTGSIAIPAAKGGAVTTATGETLLISRGSLPDATPVRISQIPLDKLKAQVGMPAPSAHLFKTLAAFHLSLHEEEAAHRLEFSIPTLSSVKTELGERVYVFRKAKVLQPKNTWSDTWWLVETGVVAQGNSIRITSSEWPGINRGGDYVLATVLSPEITDPPSLQDNDWATAENIGVTLSAIGGRPGAPIPLLGQLAKNSRITLGRFIAGIGQFSAVPEAGPAPGYGNFSGYLPAPIEMNTYRGPTLTSVAVAEDGPDKGKIVLTLSGGTPTPVGEASSLAVSAYRLDAPNDWNLTFTTPKIPGGFSGDFKVAPPSDLQLADSFWRLLYQPGDFIDRAGIVRQNQPVQSTSRVNLQAHNDTSMLPSKKQMLFFRPTGTISAPLVRMVGTLDLGTKIAKDWRITPRAYSDVNNFTFVAGDGEILVVDNLSFKIIKRIKLPRARNISSLANTSGLFAAEGARDSHYDDNQLYYFPRAGRFERPPSADEVAALKPNDLQPSSEGFSGIGKYGWPDTIVVNTSKSNETVKVIYVNQIGYKPSLVTVSTMPIDKFNAHRSHDSGYWSYDPDFFLAGDQIIKPHVFKDQQRSYDAYSLARQADFDDVANLAVQRMQAMGTIDAGSHNYLVSAYAKFSFSSRRCFESMKGRIFMRLAGFDTLLNLGDCAKDVRAITWLEFTRDPFGELGKPQLLGKTAPISGYSIIHIPDEGKGLLVTYLQSFEPGKPDKYRVWSLPAILTALDAKQKQPEAEFLNIPDNAVQDIEL